MDPDSLQLKVQSAERRGSVMIRLGRTEAMSALMERYAREKGVALDQLRWVTPRRGWPERGRVAGRVVVEMRRSGVVLSASVVVWNAA